MLKYILMLLKGWAGLTVLVLLVLFPGAAFAQGVDAAPDLVEQIANVFGWSAGTLAVAFLVLRQLAELATKLIPDSAAGSMGMLRNFLSVIALYRKNNAE